MTRAATPAELASLARLHRVAVTGIAAWGYHGVYDAERATGQPFVVDVVWWQNLDAAAASDDLGRTTNYGSVSATVAAVVTGEPAALIETVAERVANVLLHRFPLAFVDVSVHKPRAPLAVEFDDVILSTGVRTCAESPMPAMQVPVNPATGAQDERAFLHHGGGAAPRVAAEQTVVYSIGSNIEPRMSYLQFAVTALATTPAITDVRVSPVYETAAVGQPQPDFLNAVVVARSTLTPRSLLARGLAIEQAAGRRRTVAHGPRTLDVDLIAVGGDTREDADLTLPHPRAHERAFVLRPWLDTDPGATLRGRAVSTWLRDVTSQDVRVWPERLWLPRPHAAGSAGDSGAAAG